MPVETKITKIVNYPKSMLIELSEKHGFDSIELKRLPWGGIEIEGSDYEVNKLTIEAYLIMYVN